VRSQLRRLAAAIAVAAVLTTAYAQETNKSKPGLLSSKPSHSAKTTPEHKTNRRTETALSIGEIVGTWPVLLYVPGNEIRFRLEFRQEKDHLTGCLNTEVGSLPLEEISLNGNTLLFRVTLFGEAYRFTGKINGSAISGQWFASGPWKAFRDSGKKS
jgi:hypothetical protein